MTGAGSLDGREGSAGWDFRFERSSESFLDRSILGFGTPCDAETSDAMLKGDGGELDQLTSPHPTSRGSLNERQSLDAMT